MNTRRLSVAVAATVAFIAASMPVAAQSPEPLPDVCSVLSPAILDSQSGVAPWKQDDVADTTQTCSWSVADEAQPSAGSLLITRREGDLSLLDDPYVLDDPMYGDYEKVTIAGRDARSRGTDIFIDGGDGQLIRVVGGFVDATDEGDSAMTPAHFVGMIAEQVIPLLAAMPVAPPLISELPEVIPADDPSGGCFLTPDEAADVLGSSDIHHEPDPSGHCGFFAQPEPSDILWIDVSTTRKPIRLRLDGAREAVTARPFDVGPGFRAWIADRDRTLLIERGDVRIEIDLLRRSEGSDQVADLSRLGAIVLPRVLAAYPDA
jgi:hypothetical protein